MKISLLICCSYLIILSCSKKSESPANLVTEWHLVEMLVDPGDGSGQFAAVESEKKLTFFTNGTFETNVSFCDPENGFGLTGTYNTETGKLFPNDCPELVPGYAYEIQGNTLLIHLPCIESCIEKYARIIRN